MPIQDQVPTISAYRLAVAKTLAVPIYKDLELLPKDSNLSSRFLEVRSFTM